jgi:predicted negative regulator of RcsB-dependent stress response
VDRITRKELKTDNFALELGHTVTFFEEHQKEIVRYGGIAVAVVVLVAGFMVYQKRQHTERQVALANAIAVQEAPVGGASANGNLVFPSDDAKYTAATKAFGDLKSKFSGTQEGEIAAYYLACIEADRGNMATAEKGYQEVAQKADANYASLAKLSLAQIYFSDNRTDQADATLRDLMAHPTVFVSKDEATLALTRYLIHKNPTEARKLLDPLRVSPVDAVRNVAITQIGELGNQ